jgi:hypothetical protein
MINKEREKQIYEQYFYALSNLKNENSKKDKIALKKAADNRVAYESNEALKREFYCLLICNGYNYHHSTANGNFSEEIDYVENEYIKVFCEITRQNVLVRMKRLKDSRYFPITDDTLYDGLQALKDLCKSYTKNTQKNGRNKK